MGTDIHTIFQKKTPEGWEDIDSDYEQKRHYYLFSWLADVRNGYGFAGVLTYDPVIPLSKPRGYPPDFQVEDDYHKIARSSLRGSGESYWIEEDQDPKDPDHLNLWMGDHSHSWLSGQEILEGVPPPNKETIDYFLYEVKRLTELHGEIRMVFGFDS